MARFRKPQSPEKQAYSIVRSLQKSNQFHSVRTLANFQERYEQIAKNLSSYGIMGEIRQMNVSDAHRYLTLRGSEVGQKTLDMERQAIQALLYQLGKLDKTEHLEVIKSEHNQILASRSYTREQVEIIVSNQTSKHSLSTKIAYIAGLRSHELFTLEKASIRPADDRPSLNEKFLGREGERYTVIGKGVLIREVLIPHHLVAEIDQRRLLEPRNIEDRGVFYKQNYNISGGKNFSNSFSNVSKNRLNWTSGAHGLRHSYAQERMRELQITLTRSLALEVVSQELGHFRPEITEIYLR